MMRLSNYDSAAYYFKQSLDYCSSCSANWKGEVMLDLSYALKIERRLDESLKFLIQAEKQFKSSKNHDGIGLTYVRMMEHYRSVGRYTKALNYLPIIEGMHEKKPLSQEVLGKFYSRCAAVYIEGKSDIETSLNYSFKVLEIAESIGDQDLEATASNEIGYAYENLSDERGVDYYNRAVSAWQADSNYRSMINAMANLARMKMKLGKVDASLSHFKRAVTLCDSLGFIILKADMYLSMHQIYRSQKKYDQAFDALNNYHFLQAKQNKSVWEQSLLELEQKYSLEKEQRITVQERNRAESAEKEALQNQRELSQTYIALSVAVVFILLIVILWFRNYRGKKKLAETNLQLTKAIDDKELIFQELHHRVKNNLSLLESLLFLKSRDTDSDDAKQVLQESLGRVHSMAVVHQNLYDSGAEATSVQLVDFSRQLFEDILQSLPSKNPDLKLDSSDEFVSLDMSKAIQVGLIINELVTNSLKHADHSDLKIGMHLSKNEDLVTFQYSDNGLADFDPSKMHDGFGLRLIQLMAKQLQAQFRFERKMETTTFYLTMTV